MGASVDITERKLSEAALVKSLAEIKQLRDRLQAESDYLRAESKLRHEHGQIIGQSQGIKKVLHQVETGGVGGLFRSDQRRNGYGQRTHCAADSLLERAQNST